MKIVVVDDSRFLRQYTSQALREAGYDDIVAIEDAESLWAYLQSVENPTVVSLILLDVVLPGISGLDACAALNQSAEFSEIPVIVMTANADQRVLAQAFESGAVDYIQKPMSPAELQARVAHVIRLQTEREKLRQREQDLLRMQDLLAQANQKLSHLAAVDFLTEIPNRRRLDETLEHEWARAFRDSAPLGFVLLDIDYFKKYNDTYGHQQGDFCLQQIAKNLRQSAARASDFVARYGGEEFAAILPNTDLHGAEKVAKSIRAGIEALAIPHKSSEVAPVVTVSVGFHAEIPTKRKNGEWCRLVSMADQALYEAKRKGRNRVFSKALG